jgi:DNA-binding transcriptional MerR regulator
VQRPDDAYLRIGELSRRTGVSPELLRAWERRYQMIEPQRSPGGFRLYSDLDVQRLQAMKSYVNSGISAAQAARLATSVGTESLEPASGSSHRLAGIASSLWGSLERLDEAGAHAALDQALATFSLELVIRDVILPYLRELGECWQRGDAGIAQEHFSSNLLRGRLLGLARGWGQGVGRHAVLACPPDEEHDLGLLCFGLILHSDGWRLTYLGANTPIEVLIHLARERSPDIVVVSAVAEEPLRAVRRQLVRLAETARLALAGEGATEELAAKTGATLLREDPVTAAHELTAGVYA